jgi:hypothetical protein
VICHQIAEHLRHPHLTIRCQYIPVTSSRNFKAGRSNYVRVDIGIVQEKKVIEFGAFRRMKFRDHSITCLASDGAAAWSKAGEAVPRSMKESTGVWDVSGRFAFCQENSPVHRDLGWSLSEPYKVYRRHDR